MDIKETLQNRNAKYGDYKLVAKTTISLMHIIRQSPKYEDLTDVHKETLHMIFQKIARLIGGDMYDSDTSHDIVGYASLLENYILEQNKKQKNNKVK